MNERMRELAQEANAYAISINPKDGDEFDAAFDKKFAELIVRECMKVASPSYMSTSEDSVYYVEQAIDRIAEHFGVEDERTNW